ncbi:MAG: phage tail tape measure protein [Actinobacteria bacterium]|nr:phage tail tape measure protein [Actinomycetota bacterium]
MALKVGELYAILGLDDKPFQQGMAGIGGALGNLTKIGAAAAVGIGAALAGAAVVGVKEFAKFQQGMNEVFTLLPGISQQGMDQMSGQVKKLATDFGIMPEKVIPALYQAISAGVPPENVFDFLRTSAKASIGGVTDLETAVDGISSAVNAYGKETLSASDASDIMFTAVRIGKTTFTELSKSLFNVDPIAAALGVTFGQVAAALASMTAQGVPTEVATTQIRQMFAELSKSGQQASDTFQQLSGKSFRDFVAGGGTLQQALQIMEQHAKDTGVGINDLFQSVEAGSAALTLTGKGTETFTNNLAAMAGAAGATDQAFDKMKDGVLQKWNKLKADLEVIAINIGAVLLPPIQSAADGILGAFDTIKKWWDDHEFEIESKIQALIDKLKDLGDHAKEGWDKLGGEEQKPKISDQIGGPPTPGPNKVSGAELTAGMFSMGAEQGAEAGGKLARVWTEVLVPAAKALGAVLMLLASGAFMILTTALNGVIDILYGIGQAIGDVIVWFAATPQHLQTLGSWFTNIFTSIDNALTSFENTVNGVFSSIGSTIAGVASGAWGAVDGAFWGMVNSASGALGGLLGVVSSIGGQILGALGDVGGLLYGAGVSIIQGLYDGIASKVGEVYDFVSGIGGQIKDLKGPIEKDRILLVPEANAIMDGLINTITGRASDLTSTMKNITGMIQVGAGGGVPALAGAGPGASNQPVNVAVYVPESMSQIKQLIRVEVNSIAQTAKVSSESQVKSR